MVTPGVALNDEVLQSTSNNFLAAIHFAKANLGISLLDISTGEFLLAQGDADQIDKLLQNFNPSEILVAKNNKKAFTEKFGKAFHLYLKEDWLFKPDFAHENLNRHFETKNLKGFGVNHLENGIIAAGVILHYLEETQHHQLKHITNLSRIAEEDYVWMDRFTVQNLELYHSHNPQAVTLLEIIDKTLSSMGGRLLKRWLAFPLKNLTKVRARQESVAYFIKHPTLLREIQDHIKK